MDGNFGRFIDESEEFPPVNVVGGYVNEEGY